MSKIVHVRYCCSYCKRSLTYLTRLRNLLSKIHNNHVPPISRGRRRFDTLSTTYVNKLGYGQNQEIELDNGKMVVMFIKQGTLVQIAQSDAFVCNFLCLF